MIKATRIFTAVVTVTDRSGDALAQTEFQVKRAERTAEQTRQKEPPTGGSLLFLLPGQSSSSV